MKIRLFKKKPCYYEQLQCITDKLFVLENAGGAVISLNLKATGNPKLNWCKEICRDRETVKCKSLH